MLGERIFPRRDLDKWVMLSNVLRLVPNVIGCRWPAYRACGRVRSDWDGGCDWRCSSPGNCRLGNDPALSSINKEMIRTEAA